MNSTKYYTIQESADIIGVSRQGLWQRIKRRRIIPFDSASLDQDQRVQGAEYYLNEVDIKILIISKIINESEPLRFMSFEKLQKKLHQIKN